MTDIDKKRAEIREIINNHLDDGCSFPKRKCSSYRGGYCASNNESYKCLMEKLSLVGVVIKTGSEWCIQHGYPVPCDKCGATHGQSAIEPLVKENK